MIQSCHNSEFQNQKGIHINHDYDFSQCLLLNTCHISKTPDRAAPYFDMITKFTHLIGGS